MTTIVTPDITTTSKKAKRIAKPVLLSESAFFISNSFVPNASRTVEWLGGVHYENLEKTLGKLKILTARDSNEPITLMVNSYGGVTGIAMSFFDAVKSWLGTRLVTIGSGDVDSSGIIIFLAGEKRYLTKNTTMLLHLAGRTFEAGKRYSTKDMEDMLREDKLKDFQYASVVSEATDGRCTTEHILELMSKSTLLLPEEAVNLGLAHGIL